MVVIAMKSVFNVRGNLIKPILGKSYAVAMYKIVVHVRSGAIDLTPFSNLSEIGWFTCLLTCDTFNDYYWRKRVRELMRANETSAGRNKGEKLKGNSFSSWYYSSRYLFASRRFFSKGVAATYIDGKVINKVAVEYTRIRYIILFT